MKRTITKVFTSIFTLIISINFLSAQAVVDVTASGMTFSPSSVTINIGDTVRWTNTSGTHNVNGTTATFSSNPESFGNSLGTGWVYKHKFTIAGTYNYRCDQHFGGGMTGTVTVVDPSAGVANLETSSNSVKIYPIPASKEITVEFVNKIETDFSIVIYDLNGKEVLKMNEISSNIITMNTSNLKNSTYILSILKGNEIIESKKISFNN